MLRILGLLTHARQRFVAYCFAGRFELVAEGSATSPHFTLRIPHYLSRVGAARYVRLLRLLFFLLTGFFFSAICVAEEKTTWKNVVGQELEATPIALETNTERVRFRLPSGVEVVYRLSVFPEGEQLRLRLALGEVPLPPELVEPWDFAAAGIARTKALLKGGYTTPEKAEKQIAAFRTMLLTAIEKLPDLPPEYRAALRAKAEALFPPRH